MIDQEIDHSEQTLKNRDEEFREAYGFGLPLDIPRYRFAKEGDWTLRNAFRGIGQGYVSETCIEAGFHVLSCRGEIWMSTSMLERESHAWHLDQCRGTVVVAGLGMGMFAYAAAARPEVDRVIVGEIDPDVVTLFDHGAVFPDRAVRQKIEILTGDAGRNDFIDTVRATLGSTPIDYAFADIWPVYPDPTAPAWTTEWIRRLGAINAGWWGQEAEVASRCEQRDRDITHATVGAIFENLGMPYRLTDGYLRFINDVAASHGLDRIAA